METREAYLVKREARKYEIQVYGSKGVREYVCMCVIQFIADLFSLEPLAKNCNNALAGQASTP